MHPSPCGISPSCTRHPVVYHHHPPVTPWYITIMHPSPRGISPSCTRHPVAYHHHAPITPWHITIMHPSPRGISPSCTRHPTSLHQNPLCCSTLRKVSLCIFARLWLWLGLGCHYIYISLQPSPQISGKQQASKHVTTPFCKYLGATFPVPALILCMFPDTWLLQIQSMSLTLNKGGLDAKLGRQCAESAYFWSTIAFFLS